MSPSTTRGPASSWWSIRPDQDPDEWLDRGASWVLTRIGPFDLDLAAVRRIVEDGPRSK